MTTQAHSILAIDDTPANLVTLGAALDGEFDLRFATSGLQGLAMALASPPDLILLDVMMPEVDGFETCRRLMAEPRLKNIPVIFVTALTDLESEVAGLSLGAADYITKPINVEIARQRIRNLLEREHLRKVIEAQRDQLEAQAIARQQLEGRLHTLSVAVEQSPASVIITDLDARIEYVNPRFTQVTGYAASEVVGENPRMLQSGLVSKEVYRAMWQRLISGQVWKGELINRRKNGETYWEETQIAPIKDPSGVVTHYVAVENDVTERKQLEEQVRRMAFHDSLTQLPNRRLLNDRLSQTLVASKRSGVWGGMVFLDLDNFKPLNDLHGHAVGDLLLVEVGARLKACVREMDTVARFGGDEFVVLLSELGDDRNTSNAQARTVAEKIRLALAEPYLLTVRKEGAHEEVVEHRCSASLGVAVFCGAEMGRDEVLKRSDAAMYLAKESGRNTVYVFGETDHAIESRP